MDITDFIEKLKALLIQSEAVEIGASTQYKKLDEWSSIFALIMIAMVDSEYGKVLVAEDINRAETVGDLFMIIKSK